MSFRRRTSIIAAAIFSLLVLALAASRGVSADKPSGTDRAKYQKLYNDGNFNDAFDGFRKLALDSQDDPLQVGSDLEQAIACLQQLGRIDEIDALREAVIEAHGKNWRLLMMAADSYLNGYHYGFIIAGKFSRGPHRGGGEAVNCEERDRVRAMQLMAQAMPLVDKEPAKN